MIAGETFDRVDKRVEEAETDSPQTPAIDEDVSEQVNAAVPPSEDEAEKGGTR